MFVPTKYMSHHPLLWFWKNQTCKSKDLEKLPNVETKLPNFKFVCCLVHSLEKKLKMCCKKNHVQLRSKKVKLSAVLSTKRFRKVLDGTLYVKCLLLYLCFLNIISFLYENFPNDQQISRRISRSRTFHIHRSNDPQTDGAHSGLYKSWNSCPDHEKGNFLCNYNPGLISTFCISIFPRSSTGVTVKNRLFRTSRNFDFNWADCRYGRWSKIAEFTCRKDTSL